jgi:hypothetical protein
MVQLAMTYAENIVASQYQATTNEYYDTYIVHAIVICEVCRLSVAL